MRASVRVQTLWSLLPFSVVVALALAAGLDDPRGQVMLIASPMVLISGLGSVRQVYMVMYRVRFVAAVDLTTNVVGSAVVVTAAALTHEPSITAVAFVLTSVVNTSIIAARGFGHLDDARPGPRQRRSVFRGAAPLGIASIMASAYFTIDLVVLGWLVEGAVLGEYAVAVKFLSLLVAVPMLLAGLALPGLSTTVGDPEAMSRLAGRVLHWLVLAGLPLCAGAFVFADPLVRTAFGDEYAGAVPIVRVLVLAGALGLVANILGTLLVALSLVRPQIIANSFALTFNVVGNVALVPVYGVIAAAWVTVATELIVVAWAALALRHRVPLAPIVATTGRPLVATTALAVVGVALVDVPLAGIPVAGLTFVGAILLLRDWPEEFRRARASGEEPLVR